MSKKIVLKDDSSNPVEIDLKTFIHPNWTEIKSTNLLRIVPFCCLSKMKNKGHYAVGTAPIPNNKITEII